MTEKVFNLKKCSTTLIVTTSIVFYRGVGDSGSRVRVGVEGLGFGARKEVGTSGAGLRLKLTKLLKCR